MAPNGNAETTEGTRTVRRRKAARYAVPVAVAGVAGLTLGLVPALASAGDPDLPQITAQQLIEKMAASDTQQLSGTVRISTDLGLPSLGGLAGSLGGAAKDARGGSGEGSSADPQAKLMQLASGTHTLRVAADGPDRQKVSLLDEASEYSLIHNKDQVWAYDSASNEVFHAKAPRDADRGERDSDKHQRLPEGMPSTPKEFAEQALKASEKDTSVTVDGTAQVAGRDAYQLLIKPKQSGSTVGEIRVAVDAKNGVPLKFTLSPSSGGKAVVDAGFTKVDFARPAAGTFDFSPPKGAKVTEADALKDHEGGKGKNSGDFGLGKDFGKDLEKEFGKGGAGAGGVEVLGEGWTSIARINTGAPGVGAGAKKGEMPAEAQGLLDSLGDKVSGKFGEGRVFSTRLVNALMTDDGTVYVGAVTKDALVKAANEAK
ncbi:LolA family protein [Streptomyces candidus]|uniref:Outer membrane lipoprotein-sorting protein n=1 Tax=Streptomyces candidus TaxID=67283 RepID=A0A7X0LNG9_9ACTN|nr:outer membrane lipoprotein carrier protein LolA [Streptomyces candidus]MBB6434847.1 outer membrane lipoprotein-sorting protein [Streptomyces candidus]